MGSNLWAEQKNGDLFYFGGPKKWGYNFLWGSKKKLVSNFRGQVPQNWGSHFLGSKQISLFLSHNKIGVQFI